MEQDGSVGSQLMMLQQRIAELERANAALRGATTTHRDSTAGALLEAVDTASLGTDDEKPRTFTEQRSKRLTSGPRHGKRASMSAGSRMSLPSRSNGQHPLSRDSIAQRMAGLAPASPPTSPTALLKTLTPAISRSDETRLFIEFAEIGIRADIMNGQVPPLLHGQPTERISQFSSSSAAQHTEGDHYIHISGAQLYDRNTVDQ